LARAMALGLPPSLRFEALRHIVRLKFDRGLYGAAAKGFEGLAAREDADLTAGERAELRRWARRARFFEAHGATGAKAQVDTAPRPLEDRAPAWE
ncbi:MAG: hypothetical protein KC613_26270, partial [Myxococcales bacterium]|nr:hypothetical protein [Myxococcales bacterium]